MKKRSAVTATPSKNNIEVKISNEGIDDDQLVDSLPSIVTTSSVSFPSGQIISNNYHQWYTYGPTHSEEDMFGISPEIEKYYTHDFKCCGMHLADLHECLKHYELYHVRDERSKTSNYQNISNRLPSINSLVTVKKVASANYPHTKNPNNPNNSNNTATTQQSSQKYQNSHSSNEHGLRKRKHLFLDFEPNDGSGEDKIAAFDDTVIRNRSPLTSFHPLSISKQSSNNQQVPNGTISIQQQIISPLLEGNKRKTSISSTNNNPKRSNTMTMNTNTNISTSSSGENNNEFSEDEEEASISNTKPTVTHSNHHYYIPDPAGPLMNIESKPYACTFPGCHKTYKNPNGLKYHTMHGHETPCNDADKPYECPVYGCGKRYKNPNGLKYHIVHAHKNLEVNVSTLGRTTNVD